MNVHDVPGLNYLDWRLAAADAPAAGHGHLEPDLDGVAQPAGDRYGHRALEAAQRDRQRSDDRQRVLLAGDVGRQPVQQDPRPPAAGLPAPGRRLHAGHRAVQRRILMYPDAVEQPDPPVQGPDLAEQMPAQIRPGRAGWHLEARLHRRWPAGGEMAEADRAQPRSVHRL